MRVILALNTQSMLEEEKIMDATGLEYVQCMGSYRGIGERSYMVNIRYMTTGQDLRIVHQLAKLYNQESILIIDSLGKATLRYMADKPDEYVGTFIKVSRDLQPELDNYTLTRYGELYTTIL